MTEQPTESAAPIEEAADPDAQIEETPLTEELKAEVPDALVGTWYPILYSFPVEQFGLNMTFQRITIDPLTEYSDKETVKAIQTAMNDFGYECGTPDGIAGKKTAAALTAFQSDNGLTATGTITEETLQCLRNNGYPISAGV